MIFGSLGHGVYRMLHRERFLGSNASFAIDCKYEVFLTCLYIQSEVGNQKNGSP